MIDVGLLLTMAVAIGLPALVARWWHLATVDTSIGFFDVAVGPAFAGLAAGRFVAVAIDDPNALTSLSDLLIIRSGVEFWPGVVAALAVAAWGAHRAGVAVVDRWSDLTPLALGRLRGKGPDSKGPIFPWERCHASRVRRSTVNLK